MAKYLDEAGLAYFWEKIKSYHELGTHTKVLGHRGYTQNNPWCQDNSVFAYANAGMNGLKGFECDPRKDKNGVIVMLHNDTVDSVSTSTGAITNLDYREVFYKTKSGNQTTTHLTTLSEAIHIAKIFNMFMFFDMGKRVVTCEEIVAECEKAGFYNYGFFNTATDDELIDLPEYVIKCVGPDVFEHTEEELDEYITKFGSSKNLGVRVLYNGTTNEQLELIKRKGFLTFCNVPDDSSIGSRELDSKLIDYLLGDRIMGLFDVNYANNFENLAPSKDITEYVSEMGNNTFQIVQGINNNSSMPTNQNYVVLIIKMSEYYATMIAMTAIPSVRFDIYTKTRYNGVWENSWTKRYDSSKIDLLSTTDSSTNIHVDAYAVNRTVTVTWVRENNNVAVSGWNTIASIPAGYRPYYMINSAFVDSLNHRVPARILTDGQLQLYSIPEAQVSGFITYAI